MSRCEAGIQGGAAAKKCLTAAENGPAGRSHALATDGVCARPQQKLIGMIKVVII
jgi:hypothetical protein